MSDKRKRRSWKAADKLRIVLAGLDGGIEISDLTVGSSHSCRAASTV